MLMSHKVKPDKNAREKNYHDCILDRCCHGVLPLWPLETLEGLPHRAMKFDDT